ncbi:MAG: hypothetical protein ACXIUZ_00750 [Lysobacteraceae bacterium]
MNSRKSQSGFTITETVACVGLAALMGAGLVSGISKVSERVTPLTNGVEAVQALEFQANQRAPQIDPVVDYSLSEQERALNHFRVNN